MSRSSNTYCCYRLLLMDVAIKFWMDGTNSGAPKPLSIKFHCSLNFGYFILSMIKNIIKSLCNNKNAKITISWGVLDSKLTKETNRLPWTHASLVPSPGGDNAHVIIIAIMMSILLSILCNVKEEIPCSTAVFSPAKPCESSRLAPLKFYNIEP